MKLSVIIPVYNASDYLRKCLDSVINQTLKDIEIICVNDASTDNSLEILNEYADKDKRIKIISYKENKGQGYARNLAIQNATGEYIGFIDSDDTIESDYYEYLYNKATSNKADIVSANIVYSYNGSLRLGDWPQIKENIPTELCSLKDKINSIYSACSTSPCKHIYSRKLITDNKIEFLSGVYHEDQFFIIKAFTFANKIIKENIDSPRYFYYIRYGSSTNQDVSSAKYYASYFDMFIVFNKILDFLKSQNVDDEIINILLNDFKIILFSKFDIINRKYLDEFLIKTNNLLKDKNINWYILKLRIINKLKIYKYIKKIKGRVTKIKRLMIGIR